MVTFGIGFYLIARAATISAPSIIPAEDLVQIVRLGRTPDRDRVDRSIVLSGGSIPFGIAVLPSTKGSKGKGKP